MYRFYKSNPYICFENKKIPLRYYTIHLLGCSNGKNCRCELKHFLIVNKSIIN